MRETLVFRACRCNRGGEPRGRFPRCGVPSVRPVRPPRPFRPALRYEIGVFRRASASPTPLAEELMALIETRLSAPLSPPSAPAPETDR